MKIVFMGTPDFAVPCLERLVEDGHEVLGVFTQPDKPKGRNYALTPPPVKVCALQHAIPVHQPKSMRDGEALKILQNLEPELIIVTAYGKILPPEILFLPKYQSVNIHASLLPKYRGAAPIQWSILNGESETGVTSMLMNEGLDTGDMLLTERLEISENMTAGELHNRLSELGACVMSKTIHQIEKGVLAPKPQDDTQSCYAPMLSKALSPLDFHNSAAEVHNKIRGLSPWPAATALLNEKKLKIHASRLAGAGDGRPGEIIACSDEGITVACGDKNCVLITELQAEGKKRMSAGDFLLGHRVECGTLLK